MGEEKKHSVFTQGIKKAKPEFSALTLSHLLKVKFYFTSAQRMVWKGYVYLAFYYL